MFLRGLNLFIFKILIIIDYFIIIIIMFSVCIL